MRDQIDPLIFERAPWLAERRHAATRAVLYRMLDYDHTIRSATAVRDMATPDLMAYAASLIARDVEVTGLEHLPRTGPALVLANHPTGIADGVIVYNALRDIRPDLFIYTNRDILRIFPQMEDVIAPVEWRPEKRSHAKTRETMDFTRKAILEGRLGVIFPSGRLAKRRGLRLHERPWMASAAMIARKFDLPVVPLHIRARNSAMFYLFDAVHPTLRDITLFHELLNKERQPFRLTMGRPIPAASLNPRSEIAIEDLRERTLALAGRHAPDVSLVQTSPLYRLFRRSVAGGNGVA